MRPPPTRTHVRGKADAASHQCTRSSGASTCRPAGTSTKTGSGAKASLRRTRASPPSWTAPSMSAAPGTSSARPKASWAALPAPVGTVVVKALARPLWTSTLPAMAPRARRQGGQQLVARRGGALASWGREVVEDQGCQWACSARPLRSPRAARTTPTPRSRRPAVRRSQSGPARPAEASAVKVCGVTSSFGIANVAHAL